MIGNLLRLSMRKYNLLIFALLIVSCSVKEERGDCPCRLFLDLTSVDLVDFSPLSISVISDDGFEYNTDVRYDSYKDTCVVDVPRSDLNIVVWGGGYEYLSEEGLEIPYGCGCPPVYIHTNRLSATGEYVYDSISLKKNYCILSVEIDDYKQVDALAIRGNISGFQKFGEPRHGDFLVTAQPSARSGVLNNFYIPRQDGAELYLDVIEEGGSSKTFPLHDYIEEYGYDWTESDLDDLNLILEYTSSGIIVTICGWSGELVVDVVI